MQKSKRVSLCALALGCVAMSIEPVEEEYSYADWLVWELEGQRFDGVVSEPHFDIALNNLYLASNIARHADPDWETTDLAWAVACGPYIYNDREGDDPGTVNRLIWSLCYVLTHDRNGSGGKIWHLNQRIDLETMTKIVGRLYRAVDYIGPDREPEQLRNERDR